MLRDPDLEEPSSDRLAQAQLMASRRASLALTLRLNRKPPLCTMHKGLRNGRCHLRHAKDKT